MNNKALKILFIYNGVFVLAGSLLGPLYAIYVEKFQLGTPAFEVIFAEHLDEGKHIADYSDWKLISNIMLALGTLIGGVIVSKFGFTPLFLLMSSLAVISFIGVILKPRHLL